MVKNSEFGTKTCHNGSLYVILLFQDIDFLVKIKFEFLNMEKVNKLCKSFRKCAKLSNV